MVVAAVAAGDLAVAMSDAAADDDDEFLAALSPSFPAAASARHRRRRTPDPARRRCRRREGDAGAEAAGASGDDCGAPSLWTTSTHRSGTSTLFLLLLILGTGDGGRPISFSRPTSAAASFLAATVRLSHGQVGKPGSNGQAARDVTPRKWSGSRRLRFGAAPITS